MSMRNDKPKKAPTREALEYEAGVLLGALIRKLAAAIKSLDVSAAADVRLPEISNGLKVAIEGLKVVPRGVPKVAPAPDAGDNEPAPSPRKLALYRPTEKLRGA